MEYNIRVYKPELKQEEGKINNLKGFATITFDDAFCVKSIAIKESSKGNLYLDMPRYRDYETGEYVPFYRFTDKEFQKEVLDTVREAYENMTETKMDCNWVMPKTNIYHSVWGIYYHDDQIPYRTVEYVIWKIRKKMGHDIIETLVNVGYRLKKL